jgi:polyketide biosynthesis 3-hydroxy-3-methylglutaryl-CoA synthase-like enzyme PksG
MSAVGIEAMNVFGGTAYVDVNELARHRGLDTARFANLLIKEKTVALPCEDPISFGVNAAKPLIDSLSAEEKSRIELLITCTESGVDFAKSMSTYLHHYLELNRNCRLFEIKQACYSGTAGFQTAASFVLSQASPGAKALVVATDISRIKVAEPGETLTADWSFAEPSGGAGAVALLVSDLPHVFRLDVGASGYYGYEVMDACRPIADSEAGDSDLSLLSYLDCCENTFLEYRKRVGDAHYRDTFQLLAFHTPFGGMVKGAHRTMMRKMVKAKPAEIEEDFQQRVVPGINYCQRVGNIMGATTLLALASTIDNASISSSRRVGCFSYGSGCCSEFYSGVVTPDGQARQRRFDIRRNLDERRPLSMDEYDSIMRGNSAVRFGTRNQDLKDELLACAHAPVRRERRLYLKKIREFHREYEWLP